MARTPSPTVSETVSVLPPFPPSPLSFSRFALKWGGGKWGQALLTTNNNNGSQRVADYVIAEVAAALFLPVERVTVLDLRIGSLLAEVMIVRNSSQVVPDYMIQKYLNEFNYSKLLQYYLQTTNDTQLDPNSFVQSVFPVMRTRQENSPISCGHICVIAVAAGIGGFAVLVVLICAAYHCWLRKLLLEAKFQRREMRLDENSPLGLMPSAAVMRRLKALEEKAELEYARTAAQREPFDDDQEEEDCASSHPPLCEEEGLHSDDDGGCNGEEVRGSSRLWSWRRQAARAPLPAGFERLQSRLRQPMRAATVRWDPKATQQEEACGDDAAVPDATSLSAASCKTIAGSFREDDDDDDAATSAGADAEYSAFAAVPSERWGSVAAAHPSERTASPFPCETHPAAFGSRPQREQSIVVYVQSEVFNDHSDSDADEVSRRFGGGLHFPPSVSPPVVIPRARNAYQPPVVLEPGQFGHYIGANSQREQHSRNPLNADQVVLEEAFAESTEPLRIDLIEI
jgi:hypothetical protein